MKNIKMNKFISVYALSFFVGGALISNYSVDASSWQEKEDSEHMEHAEVQKKKLDMELRRMERARELEGYEHQEHADIQMRKLDDKLIGGNQGEGNDLDEQVGSE